MYLGMNLRSVQRLRTGEHGLIAMIDAKPGHGNATLPEGIVPDVVIDHHPTSVPFPGRGLSRHSPELRGDVDDPLRVPPRVRPRAGPKLATALLYGIRSDMQDLGREACEAATSPPGVRSTRSMGTSGSDFCMARRTSSESLMLVYRMTGKPDRPMVSCRWISIITRELRRFSKKAGIGQAKWLLGQWPVQTRQIPPDEALHLVGQVVQPRTCHLASRQGRATRHVAAVGLGGDCHGKLHGRLLLPSPPVRLTAPGDRAVAFTSARPGRH